MKNYLTDKELLTSEIFNNVFEKIKNEKYMLLISNNGDFEFSHKIYTFTNLTKNYTLKQFLYTENFGSWTTGITKSELKNAIKENIKSGYKYFRLIEKNFLTYTTINEYTLSKENAKNYSWWDCLKTFKFANGYILNLHLFKDLNTDEPFYEIRIGNLQDKNNNVLTLYKTSDIVNAYDYFNNFIKNIQNVYSFSNN